jgi:hypothetical protein
MIVHLIRMYSTVVLRISRVSWLTDCGERFLVYKVVVLSKYLFLDGDVLSCKAEGGVAAPQMLRTTAGARA